MTNHGVRNVLPLLLLLGVGMPAQAGLVDPVDEVSIDCSIECADLAPYKVSVVLAADLLQEGADAAACMEALFLDLMDATCFVDDSGSQMGLYQTGEREYVFTTPDGWDWIMGESSGERGCFSIVIPYIFGDGDPVRALMNAVEFECGPVQESIYYVMSLVFNDDHFIQFTAQNN